MSKKSFLNGHVAGFILWQLILLTDILMAVLVLRAVTVVDFISGTASVTAVLAIAVLISLIILNWIPAVKKAVRKLNDRNAEPSDRV